MKRVFALVFFLLLLASCATEAEPTETSGTSAAATSTTATTAETSQTAETDEPQPERLARAQAISLADDLMQRGWDIYQVFATGLGGDYSEGPANFQDDPNTHLQYYEWWPVGENHHDVRTIADLHALAETAYTKEYAQEEFYWQPDDDEYAATFCGRYYEREGVLYFYGGGVGDPGSTDTDSLEIQSQSDDTLVLTMLHDSGHGEEPVRITWRLKWQGGAWKLDCSLWGHEAGAY